MCLGAIALSKEEMAKILVVDNDKEQVKIILAALRRRGHTVESTSKGRVGVERGLRIRPDILITRRLLQESPGGVRISAALRAIRPEIHSILMSLYLTPDVRREAMEAGFFGVISKPVELEALHRAIDKAAVTPPLPVVEQIAFVEYDPAFAITYASPAARELLRLAQPKPDAPQRLVDVFGNRTLKSLETQRAKWITIGAGKIWVDAFTQHGDGGKILSLFVPEGAKKEKNGPTMRLLIEANTLAVRTEAFSKPQQRVLLIDEDGLQRRLLSRQLDGLEIQYHSVENTEQGLHLLTADPDIGVVIIDYNLKDPGVEQSLHKIQDVRPDIKVIGTCTAYRRGEFTQMGVPDFLPKPAPLEALKAFLVD